MKWIKFSEEEPPCGEDVLVIKQYLDAPYGPRGYQDDKEFWSTPMITVDAYWSDKKWHLGGRVSHWLPLPKLPEELCKSE
jgi:hypothetical protein